MEPLNISQDQNKNKLTYHTACDSNHKESLNGSRGPHNPRHPNEQDDSKYVLNAGQIDSHKGAQIGLDHGFGIGVGWALWDGG